MTQNKIFKVRFNFCGNPIRCCKEDRKMEAVRWRVHSNISYFSDEKLESMLYTPNCFYVFD